jgi:hypothetical protein
LPRRRTGKRPATSVHPILAEIRAPRGGGNRLASDISRVSTAGKMEVTKKWVAGPIASNLVAQARKHQNSKVLDLALARQTLAEAKEVQAAAPSGSKAGPPEFRLCAAVHADIHHMAEQVLQLPAARRWGERIERAEDEYMPSWPPMSPISQSPFTTWSIYDLAIGLRRESLAESAFAMLNAFAPNREALPLVQALVSSRLGFYRCIDARGENVLLQEMLTEETHEAVIASGHVAKSGELWLSRVLPPPAAGTRSVVFTSPYVILSPELNEWEAYFGRVLPPLRRATRAEAYVELMKQGPERDGWNEYIFKGYENHTDGAIFLVGLPDVVSTRPQSKVNWQHR